MKKPSEGPLTPVQIETWPGGARTISGGTRCAINLNRPWQQEIVVPEDTSKCALCNKLLPEQILEQHSNKEAGDWRLIQNWFTPYDPERKGIHQMCIPKTCLPANELCELGGPDKIHLALSMAIHAMENRPLLTEPQRWTVSIHIGSLAGQNIPHPHWHVIMPEIGSDCLTDHPNGRSLSFHYWSHHYTKKREILNNAYWYAFAGGNRAGQCVLIPRDNSRYANACEHRFAGLTDILYNLIKLGNHKFQSKQGLTPHFSVALSFSVASRFQDNRNGACLIFGLYTPILNNWGGTEALAPFTSQPYTLAWPHEMTAAYLRGELQL